LARSKGRPLGDGGRRIEGVVEKVGFLSKKISMEEGS